MKKKKVIIVLAIALLTGLIPPLVQQDVHGQTSVSFQLFYDQLSPFGTWVNYPDYGYVWVPGAGSGFRPYATRGHWVYTDDGWAWVSDYSWGWATFHYGNWFYDDSYGWMWTPGYEWAPAWVTWGEYQGNYCWAPVGPRVDIGVSFSTYRPPYQYWNFCPREHITSTHINNYYVTRYRNTTVVNNITVINNVNRGSGGRGAYLRGPQANNVERFTHRTVRPVAIRPAARPGAASVRGGQLAIYRPTIQNNNNTARPAAVRDLHSLRPANGNHPATDHPGPSGRSNSASPGQPGRQPAANHPAPGNHPVTDRPFQPHPGQPANPGTNPRPVQTQPHPAQPQPQRPMQQPHPAQPQPHPAQPQQQPAQPHPVQPRPMQQPQQRPQPQPHPAQPQPQRPMQQPHPAMPHPAPRPRPVQPARPAPPPHQSPPQQQPQRPVQEHHR